MTNLIDADDIDQVVEAMQRHLGEGTVGFHGLASAHQLNYREMFHAVCLLSADWNNADFDEYPHTQRSCFSPPLRALFREASGIFLTK